MVAKSIILIFIGVFALVGTIQGYHRYPDNDYDDYNYRTEPAFIDQMEEDWSDIGEPFGGWLLYSNSL